MYTSGVWNVKVGKEHEFAQRWQAGVDRMSLEFPGVVFRLFRDIENSGRLVSVVGPWRNQQQIEAARTSDQFKESVAAAADLLDSYELSTYELAVEVS